MAESQFVYVTYIRTTREKLWQALIGPEFTKRYWKESWQESEWKVGSAWRMMTPEGRANDSGEILEIDPPHKLVLSWRNEFRPDLTAEGFSRLTYLLEPEEGEVKLTVLHELDKPGSKFIAAVSNGWPRILASLKSLLETGESLESTRRWVQCQTQPK